MKKSIYLIISLTLFFISFETHVEATENLLTLKQQLDRLQREVNDISKSVFKNPNQSNVNSQNNNDSQVINFAAIDSRIYDLEKDIKNLTMGLEELVFQLDKINNTIIEIDEELVFHLDKINKTINKIEEEFNIKLQNVIAQNSTKNINDLNIQEDAPSKNSENTLGTLKISSEKNNEESNANFQIIDTNQDKENSDLKKLSPEDQFQKAFDQMRNKKYEDAKLSLQVFIDQNSDNQLSGSASYWLGELFLLNKNYREAALIFAEGYQKYPKSIKAPEMLYKLSEALLEIGKNQEACNTLTKLSKDFSSHKMKNKAEKKKLEMSCDIPSE